MQPFRLDADGNKQGLRPDAVFDLAEHSSSDPRRSLLQIATNRELERILAMNHSNDEHGLVADLVNDAVAVDEDLADGLVIELGDHAAGAWEGREVAGGARSFWTTARA